MRHTNVPNEYAAQPAQPVQDADENIADDYAVYVATDPFRAWCGLTFGSEAVEVGNPDCLIRLDRAAAQALATALRTPQALAWLAQKAAT